MGLLASPPARAAAARYRREARRFRAEANHAEATGQPVYADYLRQLARRCVRAAENEIRDPGVKP